MKTNRSAILHFWQNGDDRQQPYLVWRRSLSELWIITLRRLNNKVLLKAVHDKDDLARFLVLITLHLGNGFGEIMSQLRNNLHTSTLPRGTPMLTQQHKNARVQWAIKHKNDDWSRIIFIDETCYQLFRNTIRRWSLNPSAEVKRIPKNRQKIMVWGGISIKGLIG